MSAAQGWIGIDLDGTLAEYEGWKGPSNIGAPIELMVKRVRAWLAAGREVRIFTARVFPLGRIDADDIIPIRYDQRGLEAGEAAHAIRAYCARYLGKALTVTCIKDHRCDVIYDDRARQVVPNTGEVIGE